MKIGGFQPLTLSDYPGEIAAIVFTQGCNFRCPYCHNGALIGAESLEGESISQESILSILQSRSNQLEGVVISGGEPTLQLDLGDFIDSCKTMGYKIKLDTNGSRPEALAPLLDTRRIDYIAMDIKAPWALYDRLAGVVVDTDRIQQSIELIAQSGVPHQFRTTFVNSLLSPSDRDKILALIPSNSPHVWQDFRREKVFNPTACLL